MAYMTLPKANNLAGEYTVYFESVGALWFYLHLRRRLRAGKAGTPPVLPDGASEDAGKSPEKPTSTC
jgi:hypothetical protein